MAKLTDLNGDVFRLILDEYAELCGSADWPADVLAPLCTVNAMFRNACEGLMYERPYLRSEKGVINFLARGPGNSTKAGWTNTKFIFVELCYPGKAAARQVTDESTWASSPKLVDLFDSLDGIRLIAVSPLNWLLQVNAPANTSLKRLLQAECCIAAIFGLIGIYAADDVISPALPRETWLKVCDVIASGRYLQTLALSQTYDSILAGEFGEIPSMAPAVADLACELPGMNLKHRDLYFWIVGEWTKFLTISTEDLTSTGSFSLFGRLCSNLETLTLTGSYAVDHVFLDLSDFLNKHNTTIDLYLKQSWSLQWHKFLSTALLETGDCAKLKGLSRITNLHVPDDGALSFPRWEELEKLWKEKFGFKADVWLEPWDEIEGEEGMDTAWYETPTYESSADDV